MAEEKQISPASEEEQYISIGKAAEILKVKRPAMYHYIKVLKIEKKKFPFDSKSYIKMSDFEQIRTLKEQAKRRREAEESAA